MTWPQPAAHAIRVLLQEFCMFRIMKPKGPGVKQYYIADNFRADVATSGFSTRCVDQE